MPSRHSAPLQGNNHPSEKPKKLTAYCQYVSTSFLLFFGSRKTGCTSAKFKRVWLCARFSLFFLSRVVYSVGIDGGAEGFIYKQACKEGTLTRHQRRSLNQRKGFLWFSSKSQHIVLQVIHTFPQKMKKSIFSCIFFAIYLRISQIVRTFASKMQKR